MRIFFDTSVLVAAFVQAHPVHRTALRRLNAVRNGQDVFLIAGHTLAELYAVLTRLPVSPKIHPAAARQLIEENTRDAETTVLSAKEYLRLPEQMEELSLSGGVIYDAILLRCAVKAKADILITLNPADFNRIQGNEPMLRIENP